MKRWKHGTCLKKATHGIHSEPNLFALMETAMFNCVTQMWPGIAHAPIYVDTSASIISSVGLLVASMSVMLYWEGHILMQTLSMITDPFGPSMKMMSI